MRRFAKLFPSFLLQPSPTSRPLVHLFDEPQFNTQDGYIGFMLDFFRKLRSEGRLVFVCLHPTASYHFEILKEIAERFLFVAGGKVTEKPDFRSLMADDRMRAYLGPEMMAGRRSNYLGEVPLKIPPTSRRSALVRFGGEAVMALRGHDASCHRSG